MPRPYPPESRQRALDLVRSGRPVPEVARLLGIAESCLSHWKKQDLIDRGLKPDTGQAQSAELAAARKKIRDLEEENKILRKAAAAVEQVVPPKERFRLVAGLNGDGVRVRQACYALGVSTSGFYEWKARAPSARSIRHAWLTDLIGQVHGASYGTNGQNRALNSLSISPPTMALAASMAIWSSPPGYMSSPRPAPSGPRRAVDLSSRLPYDHAAIP